MYEPTVSTTSQRSGMCRWPSAWAAIAAHITTALAALMTLYAVTSPAVAEEATMRMRGSTQTFTGNVISFDGQSYLIENEIFGKIYIDTRRFECIAGACAPNDKSAARVPEDPTIAPSGSKEPRSPLTEEQRQELFKGFLEWRRKSREN